MHQDHLFLAALVLLAIVLIVHGGCHLRPGCGRCRARGRCPCGCASGCACAPGCRCRRSGVCPP